jgi:hypothetical protein
MKNGGAKKPSEPVEAGDRIRMMAQAGREFTPPERVAESAEP